MAHLFQGPNSEDLMNFEYLNSFRTFKVGIDIKVDEVPNFNSLKFKVGIEFELGP